MKESLFRKSTLERVSSPEDTTEYIRAARPEGWVIWGAVAALAAGAILFAVLAKMNGVDPLQLILQG
ncbi:MAG TPA: hypothetical protein IAA74_03900 [Candidatus Excrementavichristensenella intestinipullorum]|nr:hypothetical protein [Candidatus Excrementavichristensenella intestinipullorum]